MGVVPNDIYATGTVTLTNGSDVVTGDGTFWLAVALRGDTIWVADRSLLVKEVLADDQIRLAAPWGGATIADQPYALTYSSWLRYDTGELQGGVRDLIAFYRMGGVRGTREVMVPVDAITVDDLGKVVVYDSASAVAASIPQAAAGGKLVDGWACWIKVTGAGAVTLTPAVSTINGAASLTLSQGDAAMVWSHGGDYLAAVLHVGEDGDDGAPGATILVQAAIPATSYPPGSLWIDQDSADLDVYELTGEPLTWTDTGVNLKGPQGDPGTDGTDGTDGVNGINGASALTVVRTAATANVSIASGLEAGDAVSGVTLAANDLVLLTAQTAPAENGIYVVAASGAASRHASFATYDAHPGCYFSVCEGTGVADTLWRCTSDRGGTLGSTALVLSQFTSGSAGREVLTANRTYYVRPDGSESNNGLSNTSGGAFLTIQKAWNTILTLDLAGFTVTIQLADGTYTAGLSINAPALGGTVILNGNASTPTNVVISADICVSLSAPGSAITVQNMRLAGTSASINVISPGALVIFGAGLSFAGTPSQGHINVQQGKVLAGANNFTIASGGNAWLVVQQYGVFDAFVSTITFSGTPAWTGQGIAAVGGCVNLYSVTMSGAATGKRYDVNSNGVITTSGAGTASTYFPGNSNGTTSTGGQQT